MYNIDNITREHVIELNLLMLPEEHCLSSQIMSIFNIKERNLKGPMKGLQASSLETILHLVSMGLGSTFIPALAAYSGRANIEGVIMRKVDIPRAKRTIRMVYRKSYFRKDNLGLLANSIIKELPNTVTIL